MVKIAQLIGGAGTGKTTALLGLMDGAIKKYRDPFQIGFVSYTRAARREASSRAGERFNVDPKDLERSGWFRTLHAICYRCLGAGKELIASDAAGRKWIEEAIQEKLPDGAATVPADGEWYSGGGGQTDASKALALWEAARSRLVPLATVHGEVSRCVDDLRNLSYCTRVVAQYEQAKRLDGRCDFTDLLARFSGWRFDIDGPTRCDPEGEVPDIPVWLLDEQQDASQLLHAVCERLIAPADWVYAVGDPFQSIYGFAGADPHFFMHGFSYAKSKIMPQSFRCPRRVLELGEDILRGCSDYADRGIRPKQEDGLIEKEYTIYLPQIVRGDESWLVLTRTNFQAAKLGHALTAARIPWRGTKGGSTWTAPVRNTAILALHNLQGDYPIDGGEWKAIVQMIPARCNGAALLTRGTKKLWEDANLQESRGQFPFIRKSLIWEVGATPELIAKIDSGTWHDLIENSHAVVDASQRWGVEMVTEPKIRLGTIHSAKGAEEENVCLLSSIPQQVVNGMRTRRGEDEERRVAYVGVTRAKRRLVILDEPPRKGMPPERLPLGGY